MLRYMILNTAEQTARFPDKSGITIALVTGCYQASAGIFLISKYLYDDAQWTATAVFSAFAAFTIILWIKTFFLTPFESVQSKLSSFQSSAVGRLFYKQKDTDDNDKNESKELNLFKHLSN